MSAPKSGRSNQIECFEGRRSAGSASCEAPIFEVGDASASACTGKAKNTPITNSDGIKTASAL